MTVLGHILRERSLLLRFTVNPTFNLAMPYHNSLEIRPAVHRGMTDKLDRDAFRKTIEILAAQVPANKTTTVLRSKELKQYIRAFAFSFNKH